MAPLDHRLSQFSMSQNKEENLLAGPNEQHGVGNMGEPTREEMETRIELSESRTETKFAQLIGKIDTNTSEIKGELGKINVRLDNVERSTANVKTTIIVTAVGVVAVVVGILTYGQQWFGIGVNTRDILSSAVTRDIVSSTVTETLKQQEAQSPKTIPTPKTH
jgi:hypothetical protein